MRSVDARKVLAVGVTAAALGSLLVLGADRTGAPERAAGAVAGREGFTPGARARGPRPVDQRVGPMVDPHVSRLDPAAAVSVLRSWDRRRARAWAADDATALRRLYVAGSAAGSSDLRLLREYRARDLVVRRLTTQVFAIRVLRRERRALRLSVLDRVAGGELVHDGQVRPLASTPPARRTIEFRRTQRGWVVARVSGSEPAPRGARR